MVTVVLCLLERVFIYLHMVLYAREGGLAGQLAGVVEKGDSGRVSNSHSDCGVIH